MRYITILGPFEGLLAPLCTGTVQRASWERRLFTSTGKLDNFTWKPGKHLGDGDTVALFSSLLLIYDSIAAEVALTIYRYRYHGEVVFTTAYLPRPYA